MSKCEFSSKDIKNLTARVLRTHLKEHESVSSFKKNLLDLFKTISDNFKSAEQASDVIIETASKYGVINEIPDFLRKENLVNILTAFQKNIPIETNEASSEQITNHEQIRVQSEVTSDFLIDAYGTAREAMNAAINEAKQNIYDSCFVNRNSSQFRTGIVRDNIELNNNIRQYQELLLKQITDYLRWVVRNSPNLHLDQQLLQTIRKTPMYDQDNKYTEVLEIIKPLTNTYLNFSSVQLMSLFNTLQNNNSDEKSKNVAKLQLSAYSANVILRNFDTMLALVLGKAIDIKDFNLKTGENKYQISGKSAKLNTTWRVNENIDVTEEADNITRLSIETTPLLKWNSNTPVYGRYLYFSDFQHIIAKVKDLAKNELASTIIFNNEFINNNIQFWNSLNKDTRNLLYNKPLRYVINSIRKSPKDFTHIVFDILSNNEFRELFPDLYKDFSKEELDKMYSITRGLFIGNGSIRQLCDGNAEIDYYGYITEMVDSIFNVKYLQYYRDQNGLVQIRTLTDTSVSNIRRNIEQTINTRNKALNWNDYKQRLSIQGDTKQITFTIPGTNIDARVLISSGDVQFRKNNTPLNYYQVYEEVRQFINNTQILNLNGQLENFILEQYSDNLGEMSRQLLNFSARIVANQFISNEYLKDLSTKEQIDQINQIYGRNAPAYDYNTQSISLVHGNDIQALNRIAKARANMYGLTTSTLTKDGEGNNQSKQTFSRLLGSYNSQWDLQERNQDSATNHFILLNTPGLLDEIYTVKEYYNPSDKAKAAKDMNVGEMFYEAIVYDFAGGLMPKEGNFIVGNNKVMFLPSINSDKATIGRLLINLNRVVTIDINGETISKPLKDFNSVELEALISREFGTMYKKMLSQVQSDLALVDIEIRKLFPDAPSLSDGTFDNFKTFNEWFFINQAKLKNYATNPANFVKYFTRVYNSSHRLNPITLIDQVHFKSIKGNLAFNQVILAQIARFSPEYFKNNQELLKQFPSNEEFWTIKKKQIVKTLLEEQVQINTSSNQPELEYIRRNYSQWVNESGDLILAKVNGKNITSQRDLIKLGIEDVGKFIDESNIELNPILEQYNYLEYLVTQEFMNTTVGSFVAHPDKSKSGNVLEQEASQFIAQSKRNVSFTAAMYAFQLGLKYGVPEQYNIAVIDDIKDYQGTIIGLENEIKPFDGATFVNPFIVLLENNSLGGFRAGITKKQFIHFKDEKTGTGGIIKTAGFGITNDLIRNSKFFQKMMKKMTNHQWLDVNGNPTVVDIDWTVNKEKQYFASNKKYYQIIGFTSLGNNMYQRSIQEVDIEGNPISEVIQEQPVPISTNYQLWEQLGGMNSLKLDRVLKPSESSIKSVVNIINSISQGNWQPLKNSDIHYVVTAGAIKQGGANINPKDRYTDGIDYDFQRIHLYQAGIQLDKEHHADNSDLSLMTQVISACAAKGYTIDVAMRLYQGLRAATNIKAGDHINAARELLNLNTEDAITAFNEVMVQTIVKVLSTDSVDSFITRLAKSIMKQAREGKKIEYSKVAIPLSDSTIYNRMVSIISSYLTSTGIKQVVPGILSVLTPSHSIIKLYAGRKLESFTNPQQELEELQKQQVPVYDINDRTSSITNLELGRTYLIARTDGTITPQLIRTPQEYKKLKQEVQNGIVTSVTEDLRVGRDLAGYNVRFSTDKGKYQIWDLDSASALFDLNELGKGSATDIVALQSIYKSLLDQDIIVDLNNYQTILKSTKLRARRMLQSDLQNLSKKSPDVLEQFRQLVKGNNNSQKYFKQFAQRVNLMLGRSQGSQIQLGGQLITVNSDNFKDVVNRVFRVLQRKQMVRIGGIYHQVDKNSIVESAYELIMSKTFATKFGLDENTDLNEIVNDKDYFIKQYLRNQTIQVQPNQYDLAFLNHTGKHTYVISNQSLLRSNLRELQGIQIYNEDGKTYRKDSKGNIMYEITPDTKIFIDNLGNEVIVSDNLEFYINELSYDSIRISNNLVNYPTKVNSIVRSLRNSSNKVARRFYRYITSYGDSRVMELNNEYHSVTLENYQSLPDSNPIIRQGREKHTSFLRSLDVAAARIPSQSMQSYMPMKVVAYDNPDINTAYVSTYQILLQGSDYDIDCVSIATFDIDNNGMLQLWSPYANLTSEEFRKASEELPLPSNNEIQIVETNDSQKSLQFFREYGDLFRITNVVTDELGNISQDEVYISWNLDTPEKLRKLGRMLQKEQLYCPTNAQDFMSEFIRIQPFIPKTKEQLSDIFTKIKEFIDNHNLYLQKQPKDKVTRIINNYTQKQMYDTIIDPVNLIQAQTSVDGTTQPLKDVAKLSRKNEEAKSRTPGNAFNKYQGIIENQVGKDCIAICAVGLKGFFGLTQYSNYLLNYGTSEEQERVLLGSNHQGHLINGKLYRTLANIRSKDPNTITNDDVLEALSQVNNDIDAALVLSALLSLSTDNAKELTLSKLNATTKTIGMYIYGISIGMDFRDIAKLLMSNTGEIITRLLDSNVFTNYRGYNKAVDVFKYFDKFPNKFLSRFSARISPSGVTANIPPLSAFYDNITEQLKEIGFSTRVSTNVNLAELGKSNLTIQQKLQIIENIRGKYKETDPYFNQVYNQIIDQIEDYIYQVHTAYQEGLLTDLKTLAEGAEEMRVLGSLLSLNQGVKTDLEGLVRQIELIEKAIYNKTENANDLIDLQRFAFDESYREEMIERYEKVKHSFNILDVVSKVPHFLGYVQTLATAVAEQRQSIKFRTVRSYIYALDEYNIFEKDLTKGLSNYIDNELRNEWLSSKVFTIPKGNTAFDRNGNEYILTEDTDIMLGTDWGNATFRKFMEDRVISDLKQGRVRPDVEFSGVSDNGFIRDLVNDTLTNTISRNPSIIYSLPINMLPRTEQERSLLEQYRNEFAKLAQYSYQYTLTSYDESRNLVHTVSKPQSIVDMFIYYSMIANSWKLGENSLVPIFDRFQETGILNDYHNFIVDRDKSEGILSINWLDLIPYIAPHENPYQSYAQYLWYRDPYTRQYRLMMKTDNSTDNSTDEEFRSVGNGYVPYGNQVNTNYFSTGEVQHPIRSVTFEFNNGDKNLHTVIKYDVETRKIQSIRVDNKIIEIKELTEVPITKLDGVVKVDTDLLSSIVNNKLNPC